MTGEHRMQPVSCRDKGFAFPRPSAFLGKLAYSVRRPVVCPAGNGEWESIKMVQRYAHLAPNHLTEHARKIDAIFGLNDTNTTQGENQAGLRIA